MQFKSIATIAVLLLVVASLSVAGCTVSPTGTSSPTPSPTPTPNPTPVDYSSALTKASESANFIMERPFTKSVNERGNDVYKGVGRNATNPGSPSVTLVKEVTKSQTEAKTVYDKAVATKLNEGYIADPTGAAAWKPSGCPDCIAVWMGSKGNSGFLCHYLYDYTVNGWLVVEQSASPS